MKLPNVARASVDISKLRDYCLSNTHPEGRHKARVFYSALGISAGDVEFLRHAILDAVAGADAIEGESDAYGARYLVDFELKREGRTAAIRTAWIVRHNEDFPRLLTCYAR